MLDIDRLPACENRSGNPHMVRESDLSSSQSLAYFRVQFLCLLVVNEKGRTFRMKQTSDRANNLREQASELNFSRDLRNDTQELRFFGFLLLRQLQ